MPAHRIVFIVGPAFELLDLSGPLCAFDAARELHGAPYVMCVASVPGGAIRSCAGVTVDTIALEEVVDANTIIVVGGPEAHLPRRQPAIATFLGSPASRSRRIASVCTGAFHLAAAGVLVDHRVTTHWRWAAMLQATYPRLSVDADRIYVEDRHVWTSAGITAGIDMALAMIEADFGRDLARSAARDLVVYYRRPGGQSQFSTVLELEPGSDRIRASLAFAREHLHEHLPVERLAEAACVSGRQFSRLFLRDTGETPAKAIERLRVEVARPEVEDGVRPIELIASEVGFHDVERMRRSFVRILGHSPQALRRDARRHADRAG